MSKKEDYIPGVIVKIGNQFCIVTETSNVILNRSGYVSIGTMTRENIIYNSTKIYYKNFNELIKEFPSYKRCQNHIIELGFKHLLKFKKNIG